MPSREPRRWRPAGGFRRLGLQTTPGRIRALAAVAVLAIGGFYIVANIAVGNARDGLRVIGHDAGPRSSPPAICTSPLATWTPR